MTEQLQYLNLESIIAREKAATKGPWEYEHMEIHERARTSEGPTEYHQIVDAEVAGKDAFAQHARHVCGLACTRGKYEREEANGKFIAHARQDIPDLIAEVIRLRAALTQETCICAAVRFPDGRIARGHRHSDCFITAFGWTPRVERKGHVQGFMTSQNRFVDREEGARLQNAAGLTSAHHGGSIDGILFSEDLYLGTNDRAIRTDNT